VFAVWFMAGILTDLVVNAKARAGLGRGLRHWVAGAEAGNRRYFEAPEPLAPVVVKA